MWEGEGITDRPQLSFEKMGSLKLYFYFINSKLHPAPAGPVAALKFTVEI